MIIQAEAAESINYAAVHLGKQILIKNITLDQVKATKVVCRISSVPGFIFEYQKKVEVSGNRIIIETPDLKINDAFYRQELTEACNGKFKIEVFDLDAPGQILGFFNAPVYLQPYLYWDGALYPHTLPGFMQPNDPLVQLVLEHAKEYAAKDGRDMHGYQAGSKEDVKKQAEYIYRALQDMNIHYISSPVSIEKFGQKIGLPHQVLNEDSKQGTLLDLSILYATCLEAAFLNAFIIIIPGHVFSGVWLSENSIFSQVFIKRKEISDSLWNKMIKEMLPVECATYTDGRDISFEQAVSIGQRNIPDCQYVIDAAAGRREGLFPVYTYTDKLIGSKPEFVKTRYPHQEFSKKKRTKLDFLRDQAMDITVRSKLLNSSADVPRIEFHIDTANLMQYGLDDSELMLKLEKESVKKKKKNSDILHELYSKFRQNLREKGKSGLFVAVNELKWCQEGNDKSYYAVIYLCPAEIYRNERGDFRLHVCFEEMFINPALKVLLSQGYQIDCSTLIDHPVYEYREQINFLKFLIENQKGWAIKENIAYLSLFSIPNEAIWNGLNDESVISHEIVKGILNGKMDWENNLAECKLNNSDIYVFETDSSQKDIIKAAFERKAQVVAGPAGNGKTQTIVNIMIEAVRRGEKVLFVSEMAPAMEVAYEKLNQAFNGLFNLMIIQGHHRPVDVVNQLRKTIDYMENPRDIRLLDEIEEIKKKYKNCFVYLQQYYDLMSKKNECGKSLEELIEMYEKYADCPINFILDDICAAIPLSDAEDQINIFSKVAEDCDRAKGEYAEYVRYDNLQGKEEQVTLELAQDALCKYKQVWEYAEKLRVLCNIQETYSEKEQLKRMILAAAILKKCPVYQKTIEEVLNADGELDNSYQNELIREFKKFSKLSIGSWRYNKKREKIAELLREIYSSSEVRDMLKVFESNPDEVLNKINSAKILRGQDGKLFLKNSEVSVIRLTNFLDEADSMLNAEEEQLKSAVKNAIRQIVEGNGEEMQYAAKQVTALYASYRQAQNAASEKIIRDASAFSKNYPDLPKKVLFEKWIENRNVDTNRNRSIYDSIVSKLEKSGFAGLIKQIEEIRKESAICRKEIIDGYYKAWAMYQIDKVQEEILQLENFDYIIFQEKVQQLMEKESQIRDNLKVEIIKEQLGRIPNIQEGVSNNLEFGILQNLIRRKKPTIRSFFEETPKMLLAVCPCMIMDPSAVAEYIPSTFPKFDLVLIDEGSQMPTFDALVPISKARRCMIFGDEKQLQPMDEFKKRIEEDIDYTIGRESILTAAYTTSVPRKMLRFHYRSESESLIAFSNINYYNGDIITFPACDTKIKGVSYEYVEDGVYDQDGKKANEKEALQVIQKIRHICDELPEKAVQTIGVITFNIHQRDRVQTLLMKEAMNNSEFRIKVDELVSIVNLESCQGKEWDYVILSPGFGYDKNGKFSMGFGALNREYGSNRLNVMLTRAKKKMFIITSIDPLMLNTAKGEGTKNFRDFLLYAKGELVLDSRICNSSRRNSGLINSVASALEKEGFQVHTNIGSSEFKVDIGIVSNRDSERYSVGILVDHFQDTRSSIRDKEVTYPKCLERKGWKIYRLRSLNWYNDSRREIQQIVKLMGRNEVGEKIKL